MATPTEGNLAVQPAWRREVSTKLQNYRARRRGAPAVDLQTALPFDIEDVEPELIEHAAEAAQEMVEAPPPEPVRKTAARASRTERFEISIPKRETEPPASRTAKAEPEASSRTAEPAQAFPFAVASLRERRRAAFVDVGLLIFSYGGMLALFTVLGGRIGFNKTDMTVAGATFALFYAQYFALFTIFGGSTPGMMLRGLRVISFDGTTPTSRQMSWRSAGYVIAAGTCLLGFLWALWDDDHLCWQDRISQTYLVSIEDNRAY
jgi:uncharacterized RDD family membrane protein YckC